MFIEVYDYKLMNEKVLDALILVAGDIVLGAVCSLWQ